MPCMSYESNWANDSNDREVRKIKAEADKLARIACAALTELEANGIAEVVLLKNDELREWWAAHKEADRKATEARVERERRARVKEEALAKLSTEERELLGLSKPKSKQAGKKVTKTLDIEPYEEDTDYASNLLKTLNNQLHRKW
jgi:hypothetical protein